MAQPNPGQVIVDLACGYIMSGALATAAKLRVADHLEGGPKTAQTLAKDLNVDTQSLHRVLRMLGLR